MSIDSKIVQDSITNARDLSAHIITKLETIFSQELPILYSLKYAKLKASEFFEFQQKYLINLFSVSDQNGLPLLEINAQALRKELQNHLEIF